MLDGLRATLHRMIETPRGDGVAVVRVPKILARNLNDLLGNPLCSAEEMARRRAAAARLANLTTAEKPAARREPTPVIVYYEKDRNQRLVDRVRELLDARGIAYRMLDVAGDERTMAFIVREAQCEEDDLPIVYVGAAALGGYEKLVESDVSGALRQAVFGA